MRGLLRKDLELARLNIKIWGVLFFIGVIYLFSGKSMDGGSFFTAYMMFVSIGLSAGTISYGYIRSRNAISFDTACDTQRIREGKISVLYRPDCSAWSNFFVDQYAGL